MEASGIKVKKFKKRITPYLFILPACIIMLVFFLYPISNLFYYCFQKYNISKPFFNQFVGFGNFYDILFKDELFRSSLLISLKWVLCEVSLQLLLGLGLALLLNKRFRGRGLMRAISFTPWAISGVLTSLIWSLMYNANIGIINDVLRNLHLITAPIAWTANPNFVFSSLVVAELWRGMPFFAITILASLQTIPVENYEACDIDGGNRWQAFIYITLPYLKDTIVLTTLLRVVWEFNNVDIIYMLTGGGPANMTTTLSMYIFNQAIKANEFGYGASLAVVEFFILLTLSAVYLKLSKFNEK